MYIVQKIDISVELLVEKYRIIKCQFIVKKSDNLKLFYQRKNYKNREER